MLQGSANVGFVYSCLELSSLNALVEVARVVRRGVDDVGTVTDVA